MIRSTPTRIFLTLLACWVQWTFADPTGARSQAMYGVASEAAAALEGCHGAAARTGPADHAVQHIDHADHGGSHAAVPDDPSSETDAPHSHGCALCPLACCAGVVLTTAAAPTAALVAIVATAPAALWPTSTLRAASAAHRLPFATGPPTAG